MPIRVQVEGHGLVEFPDGTTEDAMRKALSSLSTPAQSSLPDKYRGVEPPDDSPEPGTFWGGFMKSIKDQAKAAFIKNPMVRGAAHPQGLGDVLSILIPSEMAMGTGVGGAARNLAEAGAEGSAGEKGLRKIPGMLRGMWREANNPVQRAEIDHGFSVKQKTPLVQGDGIPNEIHPEDPIDHGFSMRASGGAEPVSTPTQTDRISYSPRATYERTSPPRLAGKAPTLDDVLIEALTEAKSGDPVTKTTAAEPPTATDAGRFKNFPGKRNQGGYTSGRPSTTGDAYDELISQAQASPGVQPTAENLAEGGKSLGGPPDSSGAIDPSYVDERGWHSGAEPGSPDAHSANFFHRFEGEGKAREAALRDPNERSNLLEVLMQMITQSKEPK